MLLTYKCVLDLNVWIYKWEAGHFYAQSNVFWTYQRVFDIQMSTFGTIHPPYLGTPANIIPVNKDRL